MDFTRIAALGRKYGLSRRSINLPKNSVQNSRFLPSEKPLLGKNTLNQHSKLWKTSYIATFYQQQLGGVQNFNFTSASSLSSLSSSSHLCISLSKSPRAFSSCSISNTASTGSPAVKQAIQTKKSVSGPESRYHALLRRYTTSSDPLSARSSDAAAAKSTTEAVKVKTEPPGPPSLLTLYARLSKVRLGAMVVLSTIFGYLLAPGAFDIAMFTSTVVGTSFTVASANSINQYLEVEYDSLMKRTKNRPLPAGHMSLNHALAFGVCTGALGTVILGTFVNPISATLAFSNIILYTLVYTPMKRVHPLNTAVGAIVGAIPPLIGWAAQTGGIEFGAWVAFLVMALWQMPHFHALSWPLRFDYGGAGYRMLSNVEPNRVPVHTLLYTIASLGLAPFAAYTGLATPHFALLGALPSLPWIYYAYQFYIHKSNITARQTYKWSLYWLPLFFAILAFNLSPDRDIDTYEEDVIAIHQQQQQQILSAQQKDSD